MLTARDITTPLDETIVVLRSSGAMRNDSIKKSMPDRGAIYSPIAACLMPDRGAKIRNQQRGHPIPKSGLRLHANDDRWDFVFHGFSLTMFLSR